MRPLRAQITEHTRNLRSMTAPAKLADYEHRLVAAVERDAVGTTEVDGYPTSTLGVGSSGGGISNPTLVAATARLTGRAERDRHRELTRAACRALDDAVAALARLAAMLDALDALVTDQPIEAPRCEVLGDLPAKVFSTVAGALDRPTRLSEPAYDFVRSVGRLPTDEEVERYRRTGRWRARSTSPA